MTAYWTVERTANPRFPYRIAIGAGESLLLAVRAQSLWPGPGQQIFCLRERSVEPDEDRELVERVPVAHLTKLGRKLTVALDRPNRKRCEFLTVQKPYADGTGNYEQVFFRTESGIRAHRSRTRLELGPQVKQLTIAVDSGERYPWRFPGADVSRRKLAVGDYALIECGEAIAVVERKSFENLLADLGAIQALHHQLADLASVAVSALVVEAQLADFLDQKRLRSRWPVAFVARAVGEISAMHPKLPIVFAGNRKLANVWAERFFAAVASRAGGAGTTPQTGHRSASARGSGESAGVGSGKPLGSPSPDFAITNGVFQPRSYSILSDQYPLSRPQGRSRPPAATA